MNSWHATVLIGILVGATLPAMHAQNTATARRVIEHAAARQEAVQALKRGDQASALAILRARIRVGARAASEDAQVIGDLCSIAHQLAAEVDGAARSVATLAASEAGRARPRLSRREGAYVDAQAGFVLESVSGDAIAAAALYNSAISLDGTRKDAAEGLRRIARARALAQTKAQENATLLNSAR